MADIKKFGAVRHLRGTPTLHVQHLRKGEIVHQGVGQSFYFRPLTAALSEIPVDDRELPLMFHVPTADFQDLAVQAAITYRITEPNLAATRVDFGIDPEQGTWRGRPLDQIAGLLAQSAQQHAIAQLARQTLREALEGGVAAVCEQINDGLLADPRLVDTGIAVVGVRVVALSPEPDVARALQTTTREAVQQDADKATFERRAVAVERERAIAENELQTKIELARRDEQLVTQHGLNQRRRAEEDAAAAQIAVEGEAETDRVRAEAEARRERTLGEAQRLRAELAAEGTRSMGLAKADASRALGMAGADAEAARIAAYRDLDASIVFALAVKELAGQLPEIGTLNLTPDLITQAIGRFATAVGGA
jgi:regulator of protease activity HflC (stomatin/prohibitin superfamily)